MNILRSSVTIAAINPLASSQYSKAVMGEETVTLAWEMPVYVNLLIGDYITYRGVKFTLNRLPVPKKIATNRWSYTATFQAPVYELAKTGYLLFDNTPTPAQGEFSLTGTPLDFITLLVANLNRVAGSTLWFVGDVVTGDYKALTFSGENCFDVLSRLATEYDTEYHVSGNTIHLVEKMRASSLQLQYGSTLYDIERVNIDSANIITRLYPFGSDKNIASTYRDGSKRLLITPPLGGGGAYLEANTNLYGVIEGSKTFDDIYPRLHIPSPQGEGAGGEVAGTITAIGADIFTFTDSALDFNINSQLIPGTPAKVRFLTGACAGYDLEIASYNNTTQTFRVIKNVDDKDFEIPNADIYPDEGDTYVLLDIIMPDAYVTAAEAELLAAATDYLEKNSHPSVTYRGNFSSLYAKVNDPDIQCGDLVQIVDTDFGIDQQIRIVKLTRSVNEPWNIQYDLSDTVVKSTLQRMTAGIEKNERGVITANRELRQKYNQAYRNMAELRASVFDTDGYFDPENIKPLSIETSMLSVGAKSQTLQTNVTFYPNYLGNAADFYWSAGSVVHFTIADEPVTWNISAGGIAALNAVMYYIYLKCSRTTSAGEVFLSVNQIKFDADPDYYHFLVGVLHTPISGVRGISLTYGQTTINGQFIRTGVISSIDGASYFNLGTGDIVAGNNRLYGDGSGSLASGNLSWNDLGELLFGKNDATETIEISTDLIPTLATIANKEQYTLDGINNTVTKHYDNPADAPYTPTVTESIEFELKNNAISNINAIFTASGIDVTALGIDGSIVLEKLIDGVWTEIETGTMDATNIGLGLEEYSLTKGFYRLAMTAIAGATPQSPNPSISLNLVTDISYQYDVKKQAIGIDGIALFDSMSDNYLRISNTDPDNLINARGGFQWMSPDGTEGFKISNAGVQKWNGSTWVNL